MKTHSLLEPKHLFHYLSEPLTATESLEELSEVTSGARQLAGAAYRDNDRDAWVASEHLLYIIHVLSHFAPPVQPAAALIYSTLIGEKLGVGMAQAEVPETMSFEELQTGLLAVVAKQVERNHSFMEEITDMEGMEGIRIYTKNWFASAHGFTNLLCAVAQRLSVPSRKLVIANLNDETQKDDHVVLRQRWIDAVGETYQHERLLENLADRQYLTETFSMLNFRAALCCLNDPAYALGALHQIEAQLPSCYSRILEGLRRRKTFDEHTLEVFWLHAELDEDHAAEWLETIRVDPLLDERTYSKVLRGSIAATVPRNAWFDAMRRELRSTVS